MRHILFRGFKKRPTLFRHTEQNDSLSKKVILMARNSYIYWLIFHPYCLLIIVIAFELIFIFVIQIFCF